MIARSVLRRLPVSDYWKTRAWALSRRRPSRDAAVDAPYWRGVELALRAVSTGYSVRMPPAAGYSMLEFGVAGGSSLKAMLHFRDVWRRTLALDIPVTALGFDTFAGLPDEQEGDAGPWQPGDFAASVTSVERELSGFSDWRLVEGLIGDTLPLERAFLEQHPPVFVSVDVDYYSSTIDIFKNLLDIVPNGALFYFDDPAAHWFSDQFGELRAIRETNEGHFGEGLSFTEYPLWIETGELRHNKQLWRFLNREKVIGGTVHAPSVPVRSNISPL